MDNTPEMSSKELWLLHLMPGEYDEEDWDWLPILLWIFLMQNAGIINIRLKENTLGALLGK
jgi:hypothetical protein